jgi:glycosyltransferase involved in cell wall biosynthesis
MVPVLTPFIKKQFLTMGFPKEKLFVSPDAVDLTLFEDLPSKEECRRLLDLPLDHPIIGYIGRFQTMGKEKGIPELVEMMAHLSSVNGKRPLLLCVGGPTTAVPTYLRRAESMGIPKHTLKFLDRVPNSEVPRVIKACDVCTIPWPWTEFSAYYTSPLKLFEYMAAGVPVVASDLPSLKEILRHDENAWLVAPGNPSALADGVKTLLLDRSRAKRLAVKARQDVKAYTWKDRAAQIIELIRQMEPERN